MPPAFFVGWSGRVPAGHRRILAVFVALSVALLMLGLATARREDGGAIDWTIGEKTLVGTVAPDLPLLILDNGHAIMLMGVGKTGAAPPAGKRVQLTGLGFKRGALDALEVHGDIALLGDGVPMAPVALGRWRISGEICDGKCASGGMRPGDGIAHRACALLCLDGKQPPVFISTSMVEGGQFLLLGGALGEDVLRWVGVRVRLEGVLQRRGDMLVFLVDRGRV